MSLFNAPIVPSLTDNLNTDDNAYSAAYEAAKDDIAAVADSELQPLNLDINAATTTALGALPEIVALRDVMVSTLRDFDVERFDKLERYASATLYLHSAQVSQSHPATDLPVLAEQATRLRDAFVADAQALVQRGLLDAAVLAERPRGPGYRVLALELLTLTLRLRAAWPSIEGRSALQFTEFATAEALCKRMQRQVGLREQGGPARLAALTLERLRAYTLFVRTYDDARRAVCYLRWHHGDADSIAPSLFAGRGGRKRVPDEAVAAPEQAAPASDPAPQSPAPTPSAPAPRLAALDPSDPGNDPFAPA